MRGTASSKLLRDFRLSKQASMLPAHDHQMTTGIAWTYLQPIASQPGPITLYAVSESQQQVLLDSHEGVTVGCLHIAGNVDGHLLSCDFVQKHTSVQLLDDARILAYDLTHVSYYCTCPHNVINPQACRSWMNTRLTTSVYSVGRSCQKGYGCMRLFQDKVEGCSTKCMLCSCKSKLHKAASTLLLWCTSEVLEAIFCSRQGCCCMSGAWPTYELIESPLLAFASNVEHHIAREDRVWNVEDLSLKAPDGSPVPAHVHNNTLHCLHHRKQ